MGEGSCLGVNGPVTLLLLQWHSHDDVTLQSGDLSISCRHKIFSGYFYMIKVSLYDMVT